MDIQVDGRRVFIAGEMGEFPRILLVHGAGGDHSVWDGLRTGLGALALDLPGHGGSEGPALASIAAVADWLAAVIDALGGEAVCVAGHSMGALAALELAARYPESVRALALIGAAALMPVHPDLLNMAADDPAKAVDMIVSWGFSKEGAPPQAVEATRRLMKSCAPGVLQADLAACDSYKDGANAAASVRCPTSVICGEFDRMSPAKFGLALADSMVDGRSQVIENGCHMLMAEQPAAVLAALQATRLFAR